MTIAMQGFTLAAINDVEKIKLRRKNNKVDGTGSRCVLEGYVKDNYYARFHTHGYH